MSTLDYRLGIDVGGTNTDAVILDCSDQVRAKVKAPTTADVTSGIIAALDAVVRSTGLDASRITHAMLGITHAINAVLEVLTWPITLGEARPPTCRFRPPILRCIR